MAPPPLRCGRVPVAGPRAVQGIRRAAARDERRIPPPAYQPTIGEQGATESGEPAPGEPFDDR